MTELAREPVTTRVLLAGLPQSDVARFIELSAEEAATPEIVSAIHDSTQGNPLFVGEMVRLLAAEGSLADATRQQLVVPQTVRDVITGRLAHLSADSPARSSSRQFSDESSRSTRSPGRATSERQLLDTLEEAMIARVVTDAGNPGRLRFAHVLIRDTLYDGLTLARRVRLHRLATAALEALYGDRAGPHLAELAHHAIAGSDFDKGLGYARRAADRALVLLAYEEAARLYGVALDAFALSPEAGEEDARCDLLSSW